MSAPPPPSPPNRPAAPGAEADPFGPYRQAGLLLAAWDGEGRLLDLSPGWRSQLGVIPEAWLGGHLWDLAHPDEALALQKAHQALRDAGGTAAFEGRFPDGNGTPRWLLWSAAWDPEAGRAIAAAQDITLRREAEARLQAREAQYRSTLAALDEGVVIRDQEGRHLAHNAAAARIFEGEPWLMECTELERRDLIDAHGSPVRWQDLPPARALSTGAAVPGTLLGFRRMDGTRVWIRLAAQPLLEGGTVQGVVCSITDLTPQRQALDALHQSERELHGLLDTLPDPMFRLDARGTFLEYRAPAGFTPELPPEAFLGRTLAQVLPALGEPGMAAIRRCLEEGRPQNFAYELPGHGSPRHFEARVIPHRDDEVLVIVRDISDFKAHEAAIRHTLREKEVLLKEIHHRVKNNLQVVSSLLRLQAMRHDEAGVRAALQEAQERIQAIALIHQKLKHAPDSSPLDLASYVQTLADRLVRSHASAPTLVDLQVRVDPVRLGPDDAVPLGLILNELVSNALQHAFPPGEGGSLEITLGAEQEGQILLRVADSGRGLPESVDLDHGGLGFQLVKALAEQLGGTLELERRRGAAFRMTFTPRTSADRHDA